MPVTRACACAGGHDRYHEQFSISGYDYQHTLAVRIYLVMTTSTTIELNDLHTDADSGGGGPSGDLRKFKDVKEKSARGKSARLTAHIQFSIATEGDTERAFRKSESDPGAQKSSSTEGDGGRASQTKCKREFHHSNSYPDGGATLGREGPQMSLCQV